LNSACEVAQHHRLAVGLGDDAVDEVRAGQMQPRRRDAAAFVLEKFVGLVAEQFDDVGHGALRTMRLVNLTTAVQTGR
jgi:hypothetical protein